MRMRLIIGNKNYSSWSFRPWLAMKSAAIAFEETLISLEAPDFKARVTAVSPAGRVPVLIDGEVLVWESLAILEYLADKFPAAGLWPAEAGARAFARAISSEMHAGFVPLRRHLPMNMWRPVKPRLLDDAVKTDVARIDAIWNACRAISVAAARFYSAGLGQPTPCMRQWSRVSILTRLRSATRRAPICARSWRSRPLSNGGMPHGANLGAAARRSRLAGGAERVARIVPRNRGPALQKFFKLFQQRQLIGDDFGHRDRQREIGDAVDLRESFAAGRISAAIRFQMCCWRSRQGRDRLAARRRGRSFRS